MLVCKIRLHRYNWTDISDDRMIEFLILHVTWISFCFRIFVSDWTTIIRKPAYYPSIIIFHSTSGIQLTTETVGRLGICICTLCFAGLRVRAFFAVGKFPKQVYASYRNRSLFSVRPLTRK